MGKILTVQNTYLNDPFDTCYDPDNIVSYDSDESAIDDIMSEFSETGYCNYDIIDYDGEIYKRENITGIDLFTQVYTFGEELALNYYLDEYEFGRFFDGVECVFYKDLFLNRSGSFYTNGYIVCMYINNYRGTGRRYMFIKIY